MLTGMLLMALAFWMYSIAVTLVRVRCIIQERDERFAMGDYGVLPVGFLRR